MTAIEATEQPRAYRTPTNTIREVGGVFGVAVLASVFSATGGYGTPQTFVDGLVPAVWVGAAVVALGAIIALAIPAGRRSAALRLEVPVAGAALGEPALVPERVRVDG